MLDGILRLYVEEGLSRAEIAERGYDRELVNDIVRKVDLNEYKENKPLPGLSRRSPSAPAAVPIVQRYVN